MLIRTAFWFWISTTLVCREKSLGSCGGGDGGVGNDVGVSEVSEVLYRPRGDTTLLEDILN